MVQVHHRPTRIQRLFCWAFVSQLASVSAFPPLSTAQREACQVFTTKPNIANCPPGTLYVSATDPHAQFKTIQSALDRLRTAPTAPATILIGAGQYHEQLSVDGFASITLLGQVHTYGSSYAGNTVEVTYSHPLQKSDGYKNWVTATLLVNRCADFKSYNLKVSQTAQSGIALALAVMLSRASFYANVLEGHQDTVFFGPGHTQGYFYGCSVIGAVDFVYGWGTVVMKSTSLLLSAEGTSYTTWRGAEASHSGLYIFDSHFDKVQNPSDKIYDGTVAVARPWDPSARTMLFNCYLGTPVKPTVFIPWSASDPRLSRDVFFSEYQSTGPGSSGQRKLVGADGNVDSNHLSHMLDPRSAAQFTVETIFNGDISWIDRSFGVSGVQPASGGAKRSSTPGALAAAPASAAGLPPVSAAGKRGPAPSGGKGTPLTKQDPKKTTHSHDSTKQKSKHHSKHVSGGHHHHHHSRHGRKHHH